jgi:hypothetical protein
MTSITVVEEHTEHEIRVKFDEPIPSEPEGYLVTSAKVTVTTWTVDPHADDESPVGTPYRTVDFYGYRLTATGKVDKRQTRPELVPGPWVPQDARLTVDELGRP